MFNAYQRGFLPVYYQHHLCLVCVHHSSLWKSENNLQKSLFSPSTRWVPGIRLCVRLSSRAPLLAEPSHQPWVLGICLF